MVVERGIKALHNVIELAKLRTHEQKTSTNNIKEPELTSFGDFQMYNIQDLKKHESYELLKKYDLVIFSLFAREHLDYWFPIGYIETAEIIEKYPPAKLRPDGGEYPFSGCPVPTSVLKPLDNLISNETKE